jgi:drug/metabolite transporter (DMT)-like permease
MRTSGTLLCLASAAAFGAMAVFGKLAYANGATAGTLLSARFLLAAVLFWGAVVAGGAAAEIRALPARDVALALGLGAVGYAGQAGAYFTALERIDASLLSLLVYTYPAIVTVAAVALGRERVDARRLVALVLTSGGLVLILSGAGTGALDPLAIVLGFGASTIYTVYILVGEPVSMRMRPQVLATLVCTGAAASLTVGSALLGQVRPGEMTVAGWGWLACLAVVSTVLAIALFFAALARTGPTTAAILSTIEPLVTVLLAFLVFAETLGPLQLVGGAVMLSGVLALHVALPQPVPKEIADAGPA